MTTRPENLKRTGIAMAIGAFDGVFSGLTGVGGGAVLVPLLVTAVKIPQHEAHGTSIAIIVFIAAAGVPVYAVSGAMDWPLALELAVGSIVGVVIGAKAMLRIPSARLRQGFGVLLVPVAVKMLVG